jgi:hypothetical protein
LRVTAQHPHRNLQFIYGYSMAALLLHGTAQCALTCCTMRLQRHCAAHGARVRYKKKHRAGRPSYNTAAVPAPGPSCHSLNHAE